MKSFFRKNQLQLIWSSVLLLVFLFLISLLIDILQKNSQVVQLHERVEKETKFVFQGNLLDSLLKENDYAMITIGHRGCSSCEQLMISEPTRIEAIAKLFFDRSFHKNNQLLAMALYHTANPQSFIIDKNYEIIGMVTGYEDWEQKVWNIIEGQNPGDQISGSLPDYPHNLEMITHSLHATIHLLNNEPDKAYQAIHRSRARGRYPYSSYLLYVLHSDLGISDSVEFYRNESHRLIDDGIKTIIFEGILSSLKNVQ